MSGAPNIVVVGEPLAELRMQSDDALKLSYSGDALNVAVRCARDGAHVRLATAIGTDVFSRGLLHRLAPEGIDTALVREVDGAALGIYAVEVDDGERHFTYWRTESPARALVRHLGAALAHAAEDADVVLVSGITLAILDEPQREALHQLLLNAADRDTLIAFDPNVRPRLWDSPAQAARWVATMARTASITLASADDLAFIDTTAEQLQNATPELVVTDGPSATRWWGEGASGTVAVHAVAAVDTTGAGDAFDAAYVLARARSQSIPDAVAAAHDVAGGAVQHPGGLEWPTSC